MHEQDSGPDASTQPGNPARRRIFQAAAAAGVVAGAGTLPGVASAAPTAAKASASAGANGATRRSDAPKIDPPRVSGSAALARRAGTN